MSTNSLKAPRYSLTVQSPHLKDQAKDLLKSKGAKSLIDAQFKIAVCTVLLAGRSSRPT